MAKHVDNSSLKERLLAFLKNHPSWHAKGELADLARNSSLNATGESTGRRLRELQEAGIIEVKLMKNHSWYRAIKALTMDEYWESL